MRQQRQHACWPVDDIQSRCETRDVTRGNCRALGYDEFHAALRVRARGDDPDGIFLGGHEVGIREGSQRSSNGRLEACGDAQGIGHTAGHAGERTHLRAIRFAAQCELEGRDGRSEGFAFTLGRVKGVAGLCLCRFGPSQLVLCLCQSLLQSFRDCIGRLVVGAFEVSECVLGVPGAICRASQGRLLALHIG